MSKKIYHQAHDKLYKLCMSDVYVAKEVIQQHLPHVLLENVDFDSLTQEPTEFIDELFKLKQADLIFSANFKGQKENKVYFYFLCEHQSQSEEMMAFTLLIYIIEIMKNHLKQYPGSSLPIVYPVVLYANKKNWSAPTDIFKLFGEAEVIAREVMFKPFTLIDVNRTSDDDLKVKKLSGLFLYALKYRQTKQFAAFFDVLLPWLNEVAKLSQGSHLAKNVLYYALEGLKTENNELLLEKVDQYLSSELKGEVMTLAYAFKKEGIQEGIARIALNMLHKGMPFDTIVELTGLSKDELEKLKHKEETKH